MTNQQMCMIGLGWVLSAISFLVALMALKRTSSLEKKLKEEYWTKDVTGKTINAKTGKDQKEAEKQQEKVLSGEVEEVGCDSVKAFCEELEKNVCNDPIPCSNPRTLQLGFSYVDGGQKFYVYIGLATLKKDQDDLPIKFEAELQASEFIQKLIDHYKEKSKK